VYCVDGMFVTAVEARGKPQRRVPRLPLQRLVAALDRARSAPNPGRRNQPA
jgi:hypothetical protein